MVPHVVAGLVPSSGVLPYMIPVALIALRYLAVILPLSLPAMAAFNVAVAGQCSQHLLGNLLGEATWVPVASGGITMLTARLSILAQGFVRPFLPCMAMSLSDLVRN